MERLDWDASYAIARLLRLKHPRADLQQVSLDMVFRWTLDLPEFDDDPELANEEILQAIFLEWLEENLERGENA